MRRWLLLIVLVVILGVVLYLRLPATFRLDAIQLPPGFRIALYADSVPNARAMALGQTGTVFVGSRDAGRVYALSDTNGDHTADIVRTIARGLRQPSGVAVRDGALYVAEAYRIIRFDSIEGQLDDPPTPLIINRSFPTAEQHSWKYLRFGPDQKLYFGVGAPCNVCEPDDERFATVMRMNSDGSELEIVARGIRNSVGFDWHPVTNELWFTDNGRDELGNNVPADELNHVRDMDLHFGFPYCHAGTVPDNEYLNRSCGEFEPPVQMLDAHVAPLGMRFYTGSMFPPQYAGQIFIAEHGSWNRRPPSGYRITRVTLEGNRAVAYEPFATGWLRGWQGTGRPTDLLVLPDGSMLVSDDMAGVVYRISYDSRVGG